MILVTGGTGLVGAHLLAHLAQKNTPIRATHRASSDLDAVKEIFRIYGPEVEHLYSSIEWMEANIIEIPALERAFEGISEVYHCAAYISFNPKNFRALKKTNVEGTANLVNLSLAKGIKKFCHVSSIATLGTSVDGQPIDEESFWNPEENHNVYSLTKHGAEMEVWRGVQEGLIAVIVNPGVILGEGFWNSGSGIIVKNAAKGSKFYTPGGSGFVDVRDVVTVMQLLMESHIASERYILVAQNLTYLQLLTKLAKAFENTPPTKELPRSMFNWLSRLDAFASFFFGTKRKLLRAMVDAMYSVSTFNNEKVRSNLNFQFTPIEETIERVAKNYSSSSRAGDSN
ncbi:MAG: NAD-dependent epimerase/dehydratase family protein [Bacteroidota bacterium]